MFMSCLRVLSREFCENQPDSRGLGGIGGTMRGWPFPCWHWSSPLRILIYSLTIWCEKPTHWERPWCWERLKAGGEGDDIGWDGWMASATQWTWVWASSRWWRTGRPGVLQQVCSQRVGDGWATELPHWYRYGCFTIVAYRLSTNGWFI